VRRRANWFNSASSCRNWHKASVVIVIYDELAQVKNRNLYDVLDSSFGARQELLFVVISTQSNDPEHVLSKLMAPLGP